MLDLVLHIYYINKIKSQFLFDLLKPSTDICTTLTLNEIFPPLQQMGKVNASESKQ